MSKRLYCNKRSFIINDIEKNCRDCNYHNEMGYNCHYSYLIELEEKEDKKMSEKFYCKYWAKEFDESHCEICTHYNNEKGEGIGLSCSKAEPLNNKNYKDAIYSFTKDFIEYVKSIRCVLLKENRFIMHKHLAIVDIDYLDELLKKEKKLDVISKESLCENSDHEVHMW